MTHQRCCFLLLTRLLAATLAVALAACSSNEKKWDPSDYTVKSGDTVYAIAWRYELDADEFAAWNKLNASNRIYPGQRLHTRKPANFDVSRHSVPTRGINLEPRVSAVSIRHDNSTRVASPDRRSSVTATGNMASNEKPKWIKARKGDTLYGISKRTGVSVNRLAQLNQLKKPYTIQPGQTIFLKPLTTSTIPVTTKKNKTLAKNTEKTRSPTTQKTQWPGVVRWQRPAKGKVIKTFNRQRNDAKGIAIAGKLGDPIVAAADGKVVYSGAGLISYGNLIIIKHNSSFLSAYAYNRKLLVKEGDRVKAGQKIAEMGRKDNKLSPRLHFEIRKNGKPVDPLKYLQR